MAQLNRRQFIAAGMLGTATWALEAQGGIPAPTAWPEGKSRSLKKAADPIATVCVACDAHCPLLAYRDNGRVVQVGPHPATAATGSLCARAYQQIEALYDPERLVQPLARVGSRGEGNWRVISWDEATAQMRQALEAGPQRAWVELGRPDPLALPLLEQFGVGQVAGWRGRREQARRAVEQELYGAPLALPELTDVRTVLLVGSRPWDGGPAFAPLARALARAKVDGAEIIACSSYQGATGSVASRWLPLRPGSEAALLLGLAHLVWQDGVAGDLPASIGEELAPYPPASVAAATGLTVDQLRELARRVRERRPSLCLAEAAGVEDAAAVAAAAQLLNALGAGPGGNRVRLARQDTDLPEIEPKLAREAAAAAVIGGGPRVSLYLAYRANPVYRAGQAARARFADPHRVGLLVALDTHLTETAQLADLVLPAAADLELWNLLDGPAGPRLQQPASRGWSEAAWLRSQQTAPTTLFGGPPNGPLGEARQLGDVLLGLLGAVDSAGNTQEGQRDVARFAREETERLGIDPTGAATVPATSPPPAPQVAGRLGASIALDTAAVVAQEGFSLLVLDPAVLDPAYPNSRWGREARRHNPVYINRAVAEKLGLRRGDRVELHSGDLRLTVPVEPVAGIHPEALALATEYGHWAGGVVATAKAGSTSPGTLGPAQPPLPWWHSHGAGSRVTRSDEPARVTLRRL